MLEVKSMRLTLFIAVLVAAMFTLGMSGCSSSGTADDTSNVTGIRGMVYLSPDAQYPRICFARDVSGVYMTDASAKLPYAQSSSTPVPFWCPWPTTTNSYWRIIVYNDKNKDNIYQVNEFLGISGMAIRKDLSRGKFELVDNSTYICSNWDVTKSIGNVLYINTTFAQ
jgi:hypothetical protein